MSRAVVIIRHPADRELLKRWADGVPVGTRTEWKAPKRSIPQNDKMHAMITEVATQKEHCGLKLSVADWKLLFLDSLSREVRMVPNLDKTGYTNLSRSTADLTKDEMAMMITVIQAWGDANEVIFKEDNE